jgi:hypothetical protein
MHGRGLGCMGDEKLTLHISNQFGAVPWAVGDQARYSLAFDFCGRYFSLSSSSTQRA